jgi:hypothetical protein
MEQYVGLENRGPRITSVLVRQRIGRCTVYRPGPPARRGRHCISLPSAAFLTVIPVRVTAEKFRPNPSHIGSALVPTEWPAQKERNQGRSGGVLTGAVEQNRGPHMTSVLLSHHIERGTVYRSPPERPLRRLRISSPSAASSPSAPAWRATV